jgi:hypothetical protein
VYKDVDSQNFYVDGGGHPSKTMEQSLLWRMHGWRFDPKVHELENFKEVYTTTNKMVRIYKVLQVSKKSKDWRAEHGSGYPPAIEPILAKSKAFKQIHGLGKGKLWKPDEE